MNKILKALLAAVLFMVVIAAGGLYALHRLFAVLCANQIHQESASPDGEHKIVIFQRDCGTTTGFSTQISLLDSSRVLQNERGNVLIVDGRPDAYKIEAEWTNPSAVVLKNLPNVRPYKKESSVNGIAVIYE